MNKTSIIVDASKYIGELKKKVDRLNHEIGTSSTPQNSLSAVRVYSLQFPLFFVLKFLIFSILIHFVEVFNFFST
jgi:hypothetical protein